MVLFGIGIFCFFYSDSSNYTRYKRTKEINYRNYIGDVFKGSVKLQICTIFVGILVYFGIGYRMNLVKSLLLRNKRNKNSNTLG